MSDDWKQALDAIVVANSPAAVALRRHLHSHPEPSGEELQTSLHIYQLLDKLELNVRMGPDGCGVIADGGDPSATPIVAMRGDIDALRIPDQKKTTYRSTHPGVMHACGHDAHAACLFGAVRALVELERQGQAPWPIAWRAIFQGSEETATGARAMVGAKALKGVESIVALHVDPRRRCGEIGIRSGALTAHCDSLQVIIHGEGGHAARPHESIDPIAAAAQLISTIYQFVSRATDSLDAVVVTIGRIQGGNNPNVIPDTVELSGTIRTLRSSVRSETIEQIRCVTRGIEEITGTRVEVTFLESISSVYNDADVTRQVCQMAEEVVGVDNVSLIARPSMGSEDFACYLDHIPGMMFRLGCAADLATTTPLHTSRFDIDEAAIAIGSRILARTIVLQCDPHGDND